MRACSTLIRLCASSKARTRPQVNEKDAEAVFEAHENFEFLRARYPYRYWSSRVAVLSKLEPIGSVYGFPEGKKYDPEDARAREPYRSHRVASAQPDALDSGTGTITLEFKECFLLATYVVNAGAEFKNLDKRKAWAEDFEPYIRSLDAKKPVIWTGEDYGRSPQRQAHISSSAGDFNVIRTTTPTSTESNDLQWGPQVFGKYSGTSQFEREAHERLLGDQPWLEHPRRPGPKFVDVWRLIKGEKWRQYT